jgi:hypothetical protein
MKAKPDEGPLVIQGRGWWGVRAGIFIWARVWARTWTWSVGRVILIWNVRERILGVPENPGGVIEIGRCGGGVGSDADSPVLIEQNRGSDTGCIENGLRRRKGVWRYWTGMATRPKKVLQS